MNHVVQMMDCLWEELSTNYNQNIKVPLYSIKTNKG